MSKKFKESFKQSVFALLISQIIVKSLGLIYKLYLTNRNGYGDEGNAISTSAYQVYALILSFTSVGISGAISRLVAERSSKGDHRGAYKIFKISIIIFSLIGLIGSIILSIFAKQIAENYLNIKEARLSIIALAPSVFFSTVISVFRGYFGGRENQKETAKGQSIDQITKTITTVIFIEMLVYLMKSTNTQIMAACVSFSATIANIFEFSYLYSAFLKQKTEIMLDIKNSVHTDKLRTLIILKEIIKVAVPISITAIISSVAKNIDSTTIVNKLKNIIGYDQAKKEYGILSSKVDTLISFPLSFNTAITTALLPSIASANNNLKKREDRINKSFLFGSLIAIPITAIFMFWGEDILKFLFPNASSGADILKISSISIILITITQMLNVILYGIGKSNVPIIAVILGVITKALLNNYLVPRVDLVIGGTKGAAFATVMYNLVILVVSLTAVKKYTNLKIYKSNIIKPMIGSGILIISSKFIYSLIEIKMNNIIGIIISLFCGIIFYIFSLFLLKIVRKKDIFFIKTKNKALYKS